PTCPEWTVRELVRHVGYVHRWAATYVRDRRVTVLDDEDEEAAGGPLPDDDAELLPWFRAGPTALVATLPAAPPPLQPPHLPRPAAPPPTRGVGPSGGGGPGGCPGPAGRPTRWRCTAPTPRARPVEPR